MSNLMQIVATAVHMADQNGIKDGLARKHKLPKHLDDWSATLAWRVLATLKKCGYEITPPRKDKRVAPPIESAMAVHANAAP